MECIRINLLMILLFVMRSNNRRISNDRVLPGAELEEVEQVTLRSPLAFTNRLLEQSYQKHGYSPGRNWTVGLGLGFLIKTGLISAFLKAGLTPGSLCGLVETITAFIITVVMFWMKQFRPAVFRQYWQVISARQSIPS